MPHYRLLALDLDGTLIDRRLTFSPAVRAAVAAAQAAGVIVTLATGRMVRTTEPLAAELGIDAPLICYQGAYVQAPGGQVLYNNPVQGPLAAEIVSLALAEGIHIQAYIDDELWVPEWRPEVREYLSFGTVEIPVNVSDSLERVVLERPPTKLLWVVEPTVLERTMTEWGARFAGQLSIFRSHDHFGEAAAPDSSKGTALAILAEQLGINREHVVAIGDRQNDAPMLRWAGLGLAMGEADRYAREVADAILPTFAEDGAAYGIRHYVLGEER